MQTTSNLPNSLFPLISALAYPFGTLTTQNYSNKAFGQFRLAHNTSPLHVMQRVAQAIKT